MAADGPYADLVERFAVERHFVKAEPLQQEEIPSGKRSRDGGRDIDDGQDAPDFPADVILDLEGPEWIGSHGAGLAGVALRRQ